jgi:hypothetical protein
VGLLSQSLETHNVDLNMKLSKWKCIAHGNMQNYPIYKEHKAAVPLTLYIYIVNPLAYLDDYRRRRIVIILPISYPWSFIGYNS